MRRNASGADSAWRRDRFHATLAGSGSALPQAAPVVMSPLGPHFSTTLLEATGAREFTVEEVVQELWSGYGEILRIRLDGGAYPSVVAKHVTMPADAGHPRGWNSDRSHARKVHSYQVETSFYREWSGRCDEACRLPHCLGFDRDGDRVLLVLEDLDPSGFPERMSRLDDLRVDACLRWLAEFHATFLGESPTGLWRTGTYWHLETRPDELAALPDGELKRHAAEIDRRLSAAHYQSFVHGDAKLANFCFGGSDTAPRVAALDFQYVGGGCGIKDVAYFLGSCLDDHQCELRETALLDTYFTALKEALARRRPSVDANAVEAEWRDLFPLAWTDFHRFLEGWCPGHWKLNGYSDRVASRVIQRLESLS